MFDQVPARVWLLLAIAAIAFAPASYVYRHMAHSPARRDITQPRPDVSWRSAAQFARNSVILAALFALAIFIYTPFAEQFARSPQFLPILSMAGGAWAAFTVVQGFVNGRIEPLAKGFSNSYERKEQPKRFWASMTWNAVFGCLLVWLACQMNDDVAAQALVAKCNYEPNSRPTQEKIFACDELIRLQPNDADAYINRGLIFLNAGALDDAVLDFSRAHDLDPEDPWPLANRGISAVWKKNPASAEKDFAAVRAIDPSNPVMFRGEALLRRDAGDLTGAVESLTASMKRDPDNLWALHARSELYWQLGEQQKSVEDDQRWLQLKQRAGVAQD